MAKRLEPGQQYAHRRPEVTVLQLDLDREAEGLLRAYAGPGKTLGRLVSRLIYEHHARMEERKNVMQQAMQTAGDVL